VMVWLADARAMYDFLDEQYFLAESRNWGQELPRVWLETPNISDTIRTTALEGTGHMVHVGKARTTVAKRKRYNDGTNDVVQEAANTLAEAFKTKHGRQPNKKELLSGIAAQLPHRDADPLTLLREFKVTWKKSV